MIPFNTTQITSAANRSHPRAGDPCHPLASGAHPPAIAHTLKAEGHDASEDGTGRGVPMIAFNWQSGGDVRINPSERPDALQANQVPALLGEQMVRRLTPTECERLQGFPDGHTCLCGADPYDTWACRCADGPRYRALGNAVTVDVIEWIGRRLRQHEAAPGAATPRA